MSRRVTGIVRAAIAATTKDSTKEVEPDMLQVAKLIIHEILWDHYFNTTEEYDQKEIMNSRAASINYKSELKGLEVGLQVVILKSSYIFTLMVNFMLYE